MSLLSTVRSWFGGTSRDYLASDQDRLWGYYRHLRAYQGFRSPSGLGGTRTTQELALQSQRLRHNFNRPVVNLGAAFLAGGPVKWKIDPDDASEGAQVKAQAITDAAFAIWDRSGSDRAMLRAARTGGIYGEVVGLATRDADVRPRIEFVCPDICTPTFAGSDVSRLIALQIVWQEESRDGRRVTWTEQFTEAGREVLKDGETQPEQSLTTDGIPAAWIRNSEIMGLPYGESDLAGIVDLCEAYDHAMSKREAAIDYYAQPGIVVKAVKANTTTIQKDLRTIWYLPADGDINFLEWKGSPPDVEQHLERIRNDIAEISQTPAVAFGRQDSGFSSISGVALRILYGPLLAKTRDKKSSWGPSLEYLMWLCLRDEGFEVPLESVNVDWPDPLPEDVLQMIQAEVAAVDGGLRSHATAMANLGVEDTEEELERIREESKAAAAAVAPVDRREALRRRVEERRNGADVA